MNPNVALISGAIALLAIVLSIWGASWLNIKLMQKYIDAKLDGMDAKLDGIRGELNARFDAIDARLIAVESRLDRLERQVDALFKPLGK